MIAGARQAGPSVPETDFLEFSQTTVSGIYTENGLNRRKGPVSSSSLGEHALVMSEVRGECPAHRKATVIQTATRYNPHMQISISVCAAHPTRKLSLS